MRLLIAGASGLVGGNCLDYFSKQHDTKVIGTHFSYPTAKTEFFDTLNLDNPDNFNVHRFKPTHILHAGALTHVDYCEQHPEESYKQTVQSTLNIVQIANALNAKLIYISTDYVFDGKHGPYDESAHTHPLSIYAKHKLEAEEIIRKEIENWLIVRITNVYGDELRDKNFISRLVNACHNGEQLSLRLPVDQYATPINALNLAQALWLLLKEEKTGIYHMAGTDYFNRVQLADKVLSYFANHKVEVIPCSTSELNQPALRPLQGGLKAHKFLYEFPWFRFESVDNYLSKKIAEFNTMD